jgi:hypothetical protein
MEFKDGLVAAFGTNPNDPQLELPENPSPTKTLIVVIVTAVLVGAVRFSAR